MTVWQVYQDIQGALTKQGQAFQTQSAANNYRAQCAAQETTINMQRAAQGLPPITYVVHQETV